MESSGERWFCTANTCSYAEEQVSHYGWATVKLFIPKSRKKQEKEMLQHGCLNWRTGYVSHVHTQKDQNEKEIMFCIKILLNFQVSLSCCHITKFISKEKPLANKQKTHVNILVQTHLKFIQWVKNGILLDRTCLKFNSRLVVNSGRLRARIRKLSP